MIVNTAIEFSREMSLSMTLEEKKLYMIKKCNIKMEILHSKSEITFTYKNQHA